MDIKIFISEVAHGSHEQAIKKYRIHHLGWTDQQIRDDMSKHCKALGVTFWNLLNEAEVKDVLDRAAKDLGLETVSHEQIFTSLQEDVALYNLIAAEHELPSREITEFDYTTLFAVLNQESKNE